MYKKVYPPTGIVEGDMYLKSKNIIKSSANNIFEKIELDDANPKHYAASAALSSYQKYIDEYCPTYIEAYKKADNLFYILPKTNEIYMFRGSFKYAVDAKYISKFILNDPDKSKKRQEIFKSSAFKFYDLLYKYLKELSKLHPVSSSFNRYLHEIYMTKGCDPDTPFEHPMYHFIMINNILFLKNDINNPVYPEHIAFIPLNKHSFNNMITKLWKYPKMPQKLQRHYIHALKRLKPIDDYIDYPDANCIFDSAENCVKFENDKFKLHNIREDEHVRRILYNRDNHHINGININYTPLPFISGEYKSFDEPEKLICRISGHKKHSVKTLAKLTASAFSNGLPLKEAVIIVANANNYYNIKDFFLQALLQ